MRVAINQNHLSLSRRLSGESNRLVEKFDSRAYSRVASVDSLLLNRDISVEKKKRMLIKKLHEAIATAFSIDREKLNKRAFESLKKRLGIIRRIVIKLRGINYYLETVFLEELGLSKIKAGAKGARLKLQGSFIRNELEALEYTAYKLIEEAAMLDKRLLKEYKRKGWEVTKKEKVEVKDLGRLLKMESMALEHLEAKLPPSKSVGISMLKEPVFTHWVARVFALLSYLEHMCSKESAVFGKLKKNKAAKISINKKIAHIMREKAGLLQIMHEKAASMKKYRLDMEFRKELHNLTTAIAL